ncbi:MAG TPA: thiamine pyrophosphate-requiring protein [Stellaceae bacterium]|nr:thiamine pyrophosphate-requiring protein [Stellaceae bacterium]
MKVGAAIAEIMKREGIEVLTAYPVNHLIEYAAAADIRPIIVRQERIGLHMADAISRVTQGRKIGAFCMQSGPGTENAYGGIAQAFSESIPILVIPGGYPRRIAQVGANYNATREMRGIAKSAESLTSPAEVSNVMRRAFSKLRNGRGGPAIVEVPNDLWHEEVPGQLDYTPVAATRYAPEPAALKEAARVLAKAERPVIYAGQGVHWARGWGELRALAEHLGAPVVTSLEGKSSFPENHRLSLGSGGVSMGKHARYFLDRADVIFGIGCSFTESNFAIAMPKGKVMIHATLDPDHLNKDIACTIGLVGDAALTLEGVLRALQEFVPQKRDDSAVAREIATSREGWLAEWRAKLTDNAAPLTPYRVIWDMLNTVDVENTIVTHDAGSPRDQITPFWQTKTPHSYIGWGKTTQLGYGLGLAMGAKLAHPDKLCINVWGDAAIGFTGMDFETAARNHIPILSVLFNNDSMACELHIMETSTKKFRSTDISGNYADLAKALGGYGERVTDAAEIVPALKRGIAQTKDGRPALLEFITRQETAVSRHPPTV